MEMRTPQTIRSDQLDDTFFRTLVESMPQMVWTKDADGRNDFCNARFLESMGITVEEFLNGAWLIVHPDDVARGQAAWRDAVTAGSAYDVELRLRSKNAEPFRWYLVRAVPHRNAHGQVDKWFGTTTDVDVQHRALAALDFLAQSSASLAAAPDVDTVLDRLAHASLAGLADISIFDLEESGIFHRVTMTAATVTEEQLRLVQSFGGPDLNEAHPISRAILTQSTVYLPTIDPDYVERSVDDARRRNAWELLHVRSLVSAPMVLPDRVRGALTLVRLGNDDTPFGAAEVNVIEEVARRAAVAIDAVRQTAREQRVARDFKAFADLGESITGAVGLAQTLDAAMAVVVPSRADWGYVNLTDDNGELRLAGAYHPSDDSRQALSAHLGELYGANGLQGATRDALRTRGAIFRELTPQTRADGIISAPILEKIRRIGMKRCVVVPLFSGSTIRGTLHFCMTGDESKISQSDIGFFEEFARRLAPAIENAERFERERRVAQSFQSAALPASLPDIPGFRFSAIYEAGRAEALVGGDWYDAFTLADGTIVVSIGDVAGSGLTAAVTMSGVRQAIRGAAHVEADPCRMLASADRALQSADHRFVTSFVGIIDPKTSTLVYQSAGHLPALLALPDGTVRELSYGGTPLGVHGPTPDTVHVQGLPSGSLLVLYTDGLVEHGRDLLEGEAQLREVLQSEAIRTAHDPAKHIQAQLLANGSNDDVAILTIAVE